MLFCSSFSQLCLEMRKLMSSMILPFENSSPIPARRGGEEGFSTFAFQRGGRKKNK